MRPALTVCLAAMLAVACVPSQDKDDRLLADGLWGWDGGQGCLNRADAVRIEGSRLVWYRDGAEHATGQALARDLVREAGEGEGALHRVSGLVWSYHLDGGGRVEGQARRDRFIARFDAGTHRLTYLELVERQAGAPLTAIGTDRLHDRLAPCETATGPVHRQAKA